MNFSQNFRFLTMSFGLLFALLLCTENIQAQQEVVLKSASKAEWQKALDQYGASHRIVAWDIQVVNNQPRYYLVMRQGKVPGYQIRTGRTAAAFAELKREYHERGYTFKKQVEYVVNGRKLYGGYWER